VSPSTPRAKHTKSDTKKKKKKKKKECYVFEVKAVLKGMSAKQELVQ
jgi:hypothetical protein